MFFLLFAFLVLACAKNTQDRIFLWKNKEVTASYACNNTYTFFSAAEKITFVVKDNLYIEHSQVTTIQYGTDKFVAKLSCFGQFDCFVMHNSTLGKESCKELASANINYEDFHLSFHQKDTGFRMLAWREQDGSQIVQDCLKI